MHKQKSEAYSAEVLSRIKVLREQGFGNRIIAKAVGIPRHTVCALLRKLGYDAKCFTPETRGRRAFPQETIDLVLQRRAEGVSNRDIALEARMFQQSVTQILRRHGFRAASNPPQAPSRFFYSEEVIKSVLQLRKQGSGSHVVARQAGISRDAVKQIFRRAGFMRHGCSGGASNGGSRGGPAGPQVRADISYLNLTPEMAWCLGLIYGDGHLSNVGHQMHIISSDRDVIEKYAKIHGNLRIIYGKTYSQVTWTCARLYRELESYGLCANKSDKLKFPQLHPSLLPHFVRGLIDSDGSFYRKGPGKLADLLAFCYACICEPFMSDLRNAMVEHAGVSASLHVKSRLQKDTPNTVWFIKYSHANATKLGRWVYGPSTEAMRGERKYARWYAAKDRLLWPNRSRN